MWGDIFFVDPANDYAQGMEPVAIWADPGLFTGSDLFTFYGRFSNWDGRDDRVPLPWRWDQRFLNGGAFSGGTEVIVWRDPGDSAASPLPCGVPPPWWPLTATVGADNEAGDGHVALPSASFPLVTQRVDLTTLPIPYAFGWMQVSTPLEQAWIVPTFSAEGRYSVGVNGTPVSFLCTQTPP